MFYDMHLVFPLTEQGNVFLTDIYCILMLFIPHSYFVISLFVYLWMGVPQGS